LLAATPPWHVLGAGAIGGLWALRMASAGIPVTLLSHRGAATVRTLTLQDGDQLLSHSFLQESVSQPGQITRLLVTTKSNLTASALAPLLPSLAAGTPLLLLQNGMGADDALQAQRPDLALLVGITTDGVWRRDENTLVQAGHGETLMGACDKRDEKTATTIAAELAATGANIRFDTDIRLRRWEKLAMNCAINPLTALYHCRNGELLEKPEALAQMRQIAEEVAGVMQAEGMTMSTANLYQRICSAAEKTAANISSMHADVAAGRATEIAFINGYVVGRAERRGLDVPLNRRLLADILALSRKNA
jgi:2-dehydropantoate 2-reductase